MLHGRPLPLTPAGSVEINHAASLFESEEGNVAERFAALGAMSNAYTNHTATTYLFSTSERFQEALELLLRFVQQPYFTEESVRKEQGIIGQELRMYLDDPRVAVFQNLMEALYHEHPVRVEIGGTVESIERISVDDLYLCHRTFYSPSNMVFFATGDVDPAGVFDAVHRLVPSERSGPVERLRPKEPEAVRSELVRRAMPVGVPLIDIGFKDDPARENPLQREIEMEILLDWLVGSSSGIYQTLYAEGLVSEHFRASYFSGHDFAASVRGGPTPDPDRLLARLLALLGERCRAGLARDAVERERGEGGSPFAWHAVSIPMCQSPARVASRHRAPRRATVRSGRPAVRQAAARHATG